jgi:hypothetical protein
VPGAAIRPQLDREIFHGSVALVLHLHLYMQSIACSRLAQSAVVHEEPVDRTAVYCEHRVGVLHSCGVGLGLEADSSPVRVAEIERRASVLAGVPLSVDAVVNVSCQRCD